MIVGLQKRSQYRIDRKLGEGANGQVYLATDERKSGKYAVKVGYSDTDLRSEIAVLTRSELLQAVKDNPVCRQVAPVLTAMIEGRYRDSRQAAEHWRSAIGRIGIVPWPEGRIPWLEGFVIAALFLFAISLYWTMD